MPATTPATRWRVLGCLGSPKRNALRQAIGRAPIGPDVARMVVALHLEHYGEAVADRDHAGVLARSLDHPGGLGRQGLEMDFRGLVRAVLVPHRRKDAELG